MLSQITCPRCQTPFSADIHQVVDAGRQPQLKYELLNGRLNMFTCPNCGASGQMATPLLYHDPEHELFMVHVPMELNLPHAEQQQLIGKLVQEVMNQTPPEERRGYMLQPQEVISYQTFMEKILETEGVTPEMIAQQRAQVELLQRLAQVDREERDRLLAEHMDDIDEAFFAMLHSMIEAAQQQGNEQQLLNLVNLQAKLYTETELGQQLEKRQSAMRAFQKAAQKAGGLSQEMLLSHILKNKEDEATVEALVAMGQQALDYQFFALLTEKIEEQARQHNKEEAQALTKLRQRLLEMQKTIQDASRQALDQAMATLQTFLEAEDKSQAIQDHAAEIDDTFMYVLSALIQQSEQQGQEEQVAALREIHDLILEEAEQQVPPQIRLLNDLLRVETDDEQRRILDENADLINAELAQMLESLAQEMGGSEQEGGAELSERLRKLQAMVEMRTAALS